MYRFTEFVRLKPKMYCLIDEKHVIHNAASGVPCNVVIYGERMSVKKNEMHKRAQNAKMKGNANIKGSLKRINNQGFDITTKEHTKTLMTCTDIKRKIMDHNIHTLV